MYENLKGKKVYIYTLGCKVNQYESDAMYERLEEYGCIPLAGSDNEDPSSAPDICIINTCSVTNMADKKSRQIINRMRKLSPNAVIIATGCYVQAASEDIIKRGVVDIIIGNNRKSDCARIISDYLDAHKTDDNFIDINKDSEYDDLRLHMPEGHTRAYIKIQDGCNSFCTYCIIPYVRGRIRSRKLSEVVSEINDIVSNGVKEVVLTGINLSSYDDADVGASLIDVICKVSEIPGLERIRLGSLEPRVITDEFLSAVQKLPNFCPHFHLSLQSACDNTLKRMNRKYTIAEFIAVCDKIRQYFDRPALTTDVIVGFPGETDEDFEVTFENLRRINFYEMHVFKYSRRKGTVADKMPDQIPENIKNIRSDRLLSLSEQNKQKFEESFMNEPLNILIEEKVTVNDKLFYRGHTERYILIDIPAEYISENYPDIENPINMIIRYNR
ncbi:MAG: tRNA (N(6)-L-threonylcarbamoyladenosine(37)-C(2))-methylthiotransferase MtaB [Eubacterium sp.]|nr:tRNA (N(6)-L-threonylcarbamoyladenosine(37)-C(2))-methylthiotransferase MtaB [Eubacterium sp.]